MRALCLILVLAVLISSTMAKPKPYINKGDRDKWENIISSSLEYLRHQNNIVNGKIIAVLIPC